MAADLKIIVTLKDKASKALTGIKGKATALGGAVGKVMRAGVLAGAAGLGMLGVAAVKLGMDFEKGMSEVRTLMPELGEEGFKNLQNDVLNFSKEMGIATDKAVPALYQAISAGVPKENVIEFMRTNAKLAIGGVTDLETAVDLTTTALNAFGLEAKHTEMVSDILFTGVKLGKTTIQELGQSLFQVAPAAAAAGVPINEVTAALATLTASGTPTSVAATQIRQAIVEMGKEGTKANKAFQDIADVGFREFMETGGSMGEAMELLAAKAKEDGIAVSDLFGSVEAGLGVQVLAGKGFDKFTESLEATRNASGATDIAFETMEKTASRKLQKAINMLKVTLTRIGIKVLPHIAKALVVVTDVLSGFIAGFERFNDPDITSKGAFGFGERLFVIFRNKVYPALKSIADFLRRDFFPTFISGLKTLREAFEPVVRFILNNKAALIAAITAIGVAIVLAFGPGAVAVAAIVGLIVVLGLLRDNWDEIKAKVTEVVDSIIAKVEGIPVIGTIFRVAVEHVTLQIKTMISAIKNVITIVKAWVAFFQAIFRGDFKEAWRQLKIIAKAQLDLLLDYLKFTFLNGVKAIFKALKPWDWVKSAFNTAKDNMKGAFQDVLDFIEGLPTDLKTAASSVGSSIIEGLKEGIGAVGGIAEDIAATVGRAIKGFINTEVIGKINRALEFSVTVGAGPFKKTFSINPPDIPHLHKGGEVIRSGLAEVKEGERYSMGGGVTINFNHYGTLMGNEAEAERFAGMMDARLRRKWRRQYA